MRKWVNIKHQIRIFKAIFLLWKLWLWMIYGIREGQIVYEWSESKDKWIMGYVKSINNDGMLTDWKPMFDITIEFFEPIQGNDHSVYSRGHYSFKSMKESMQLSNQYI